MDYDRYTLTREDANKALDNINMWINNCDTKASIILAFYTAIITVFLQGDFMSVYIDTLKNVMANFFS